MTDLKPMWERIAVALPKVLEGWSVECPNWFTVDVYAPDGLWLSFDPELPLEARAGTMRIMDELEARNKAWFDRDYMGSGFYTVSSMTGELEPIALAKGKDLADPYVECLMLTLEALADA